MNGMLQHDIYRQAVDARQREAEAWARANSHERIARTARDRATESSRSTRLIAVVAPSVGLLALIVASGIAG